MQFPTSLAPAVLLCLFAAPSARAQDEAPPEPATVAANDDDGDVPQPQATLPESAEDALRMQRELGELVEGADRSTLENQLRRWTELAQGRSQELRDASAAPEGSPERESALSLRSELDTLLAGAETLAAAVAAQGGDVTRARDAIADMRADESEALDASTVPANRTMALQLPVEVLKAQLRPLTREQVEEQLGQWMVFLQKTCLEVRNVEVAALRTEVPEEVEAFNARAVNLRGERGSLIKRVRTVIAALERKGGDVEEARAYLDSVVVNPPITGWRAAWVTASAWLTDKEGGIALAVSAGSALLIFAAFWFLAKLLARIVRRATRSVLHSSELLREFLVKSIGRLTVLVGLLIALSTLGVNMTPLVAAIGAAGLVIGLALQGTLSNLASGLMIMVYRPFDVGDAVSVAGTSGKVDGMTLMTTAIKTFDNQTIYIPNNRIWGDVITNITANETRRVDMVFGIGYGDDVAKAKAVLERTVTAHAKVLSDPAPVIRVHALGDSSVDLVVRPWVRTPDYWEVFWDLTEQVKAAFDAEGISIPFPQRDVHLIREPEFAPEVAQA